MRPIDADTLIVELQKDEALFDNEAIVARENSIKYTNNYAKIMWSRANGIRDAIVEVYDAPTIDVDRPKGEWIESNIPNEKYVCSVCGGACWYYDREGDVAKSNFCPNCGADMRAREDG